MSAQSVDAQIDISFSRHDRTAYGCFFLLLVSIIFLQKFGVNVSGDIIIPIGLPVAYAVIGFGILRGVVNIDPIRFMLFSLFAVFALFGINSNPTSSFPSFLLVSVLAFTYVFEINVSAATFMRCMNLFIVAMMLTAPVILLEWALQIVLKPGMWIDLEIFVPSALLVPGYMYHHPTAFQSPWMQPSAGVFLEVSILSQFLAIAFMMELAYFRRPVRLAILSLAMLITLGGSGPFLLTLSLPFLLAYTPQRLLIPGLLFAVVLLWLLSFSSLFSQFADRIFEYQDPLSSSHGRYVVPFEIIGQEIATGDTFFLGNGPGTGDAVGAGFSLGKLLYEYGFLATICYYGCFLRMLFRSGHSPLVIWALFIYFSFLGGGLAVPLYPLACMVLGGFISIRTASGPESAFSKLNGSQSGLVGLRRFGGPGTGSPQNTEAPKPVSGGA